VAVEVIVAGDLDLQTVGVLQMGRAVAALFGLVTVKRIWISTKKVSFKSLS
jgi:hypothetical protein